MQIAAELRAARVISLNKISRHLIIRHIYISTADFISLDPKVLLKCRIRITEAWNALDWKAPSEAISSNTPAVSSGIIN